MSMKQDLTGEQIRLVADDIPDRIPEGMVEADAPLLPLSLSPDKMVRHAIRRGFMDHGFMYDPNRPSRFPSSRDWNMPTIKCKRKTCAANYKGECVMPSLIKIGANGKCEGCHDRKEGKKKSGKKNKE